MINPNQPTNGNLNYQQILQYLQNMQGQGAQRQQPNFQGMQQGFGSAGSSPGTGTGLSGLISGNSPIYGQLGLGTQNPIPANYGPNSSLQQTANMTGQSPMSLMPESTSAPGALSPDQLSSGSMNGSSGGGFLSGLFGGSGGGSLLSMFGGGGGM